MDSTGHKVAPMSARQRRSVDVDLPDRDSAAGKNIAATVKNTVRRLLRRTKSHREPCQWLLARTNDRKLANERKPTESTQATKDEPPNRFSTSQTETARKARRAKFLPDFSQRIPGERKHLYLHCFVH